MADHTRCSSRLSYFTVENDLPDVLIQMSLPRHPSLSRMLESC